MKYSTFFRVTTAEYKGCLIIIAHFSAGVFWRRVSVVFLAKEIKASLKRH